MGAAINSPFPADLVARATPTAPSRDRGEQHLVYKAPTIQTPYMVMSVQANEASALHNLLAATYSWITLAGYVVLPGTFTSIANSSSLHSSSGGKIVQKTVENLPLLPLAGLCFLSGTIGSCFLWRKWRTNYVWLVAKLFLPGLLHSIVGLITTLINVYTAQRGHWSVTAKMTISIVGFYLGVTLVLTLIYNFWFLEKIKTPHDRELAKRSTQ